MLDWTDSHCRYFHRLMTKNAVLYTEMVTTGAIIYGKGDYLGFNEQEHPLVLQLGGCDPEAMAHCASLAKDKGYDEVNINVGCPSDRVKNGRFGASLMASPEIVSNCVKAMQQKTNIPITVKCRIGIDDMDEESGLDAFIDTVQKGGCNHFVVHARKAWLQGLSPKQNRDIPPLNYERVYRLKEKYPHLHISINGGISDLKQAKEHLLYVDGIMMGREAYSNPYILSEVDTALFNSDQTTLLSREQIVSEMTDYIEKKIQSDPNLKVWHIARHMLGLFQSQAGGKIWRRFLSENGTSKNANTQLLIDAYEQVQLAQQRIKDYV